MNKIFYTPDNREYYSSKNFKIRKLKDGSGVYCTCKVKANHDADIGLFDRKINKNGRKINKMGKFYEIALASYDNTLSSIH